MACNICGRERVYHGSEHPSARPGTYLSEAGCQNGVWMDDDEFAEGWDPNVAHPPCAHNPAACDACEGRGWNTVPVCCGKGNQNGCCGDPDPAQEECDKCGGTGWKDGKHQQPDDRYANPSSQEGSNG